MVNATGLYNSNKEDPRVLKPIFKGSNDNKVLSVDISKKGNMFVSASADGNVKIWDLNKKTMLKTLMFNDLVKAIFLENGKKLIITTRNSCYIYNTSMFKRLSKIKYRVIKDCSSSKDGTLLNISYDYGDKQDVYNIVSGKLLHTFKRRAYKTSFSPNKKYLLLSDNYNISVIDLKTWSLLTTLPKFQSKIRSFGFIDDQHVFVFTSGYDHSYGYLFDIKTAELIYKSYDFKKYGIEKALYTGEKYNFILFDDGNAKLFNLKLNKVLKEFFARGKSKDDGFTSVFLSNGSMIATGYEKGDMKIYPAGSFLYKASNHKTLGENSSDSGVLDNAVSDDSALKSLPVDNGKNIERKPEVITKTIIIKEEKKKNMKPFLQIYASKTSGYIPLDVSFKIIANDEDGEIKAYYLNIAGKEFIGKGTPMKVFPFTFDKPGLFKVMASVKDNKNAVSTKEISIKVREESFDDFKNNVFGKDKE